MCIPFVYEPGRDVISFEIKGTLMQIFLIQPFFHMTKKLQEKFKYLENEKRF